MKNVLVTGGAGFIGSHLCDRLVEEGYKVICLDNLLTGDKKNIEHLLDNSNFKFIEADTTQPLDIGAQSLDYIFHLASPASPVDFKNYSEEILLANSMGILNVLKLTKETGAKLLVASTSEAYGDPLEHPQKETYYGNVNTFGIRACYDESKRFGEAATYVYIKKYDVDARIIRIFNTYGPRMQKDDGRVVTNFILDAFRKEPLIVDGDGSQTRSFCYVDDLVSGIMKVMFTEGTKGEIFNLGNPGEFTVKELAEMVIKLTNTKSEIKFNGTFRENDPMKRCPDISKVKEATGWEPKINLEEGLVKTIDYYKSIV
jgi:nucleoside-diphosphate-sugar epimerase